VLLCIAADTETRLRDVAGKVGITERAAQRIVADLVDEGYLTRSRVGRRNQYLVHSQLRFRHPIESQTEIGELLRLLTGGANGEGQRT
jgi:predicted transcriptional regulator